MERIVMPWNVSKVCKMVSRGDITFENPLQRPAEQWKFNDKSLLIDSLLTMFVPDIYAIQVPTENNDGEKVNKYDIIDGKQRLTTISSYIADEWALTELNPIKLDSTGKTFNISGKKFSELPEDIQDEINNFTLSFKVIMLDGKDNKESVINDIFYRLNNGKAVSREHLALVTANANVQNFVRRIITSHKLFNEVSHFAPGSIKKSDREMTILQSIILISGVEYPSLSAKDVEKFYKAANITEEMLELTENSFDDIVNTFPSYSKNIVKSNIPILSFVFANMLDEQKGEKSELIQRYFNENMRKGDKYKSFCGAGTAHRYNVKGRINAIQEICNIQLPQVAK